MKNMTTRLHSAALDVDIKHESETGIVTVKELRIKKIAKHKLVYKNEYIQYSGEECRIIKESITEIDRTVHLTKRIFDGVLINYTGTRPEPEPVILTETGIIEPSQIDLF